MTNTKSNRLIAGLISVMLFFALFYDHHGLGLNVLLFALGIFFLIQFFANWNRKTDVGIVLIPVVAGISVLWHGNELAMFAVVFAFFFLSAKQSNSLLTFWEGTIIAFFNFLLSPILLALNVMNNASRGDSTLSRFKLVQALPLFLVLLFGLLYYQASPVFANLVNQLKWLNLGEIIFVLFLGAMISHTLLNTKTPGFIIQLIKSRKPISEEASTKVSQKSWIITIWTLCLLLSFVIASDFYYRFVLQMLPAGLSLSSYLHQGVNSLVFSVVLASSLSLLVISNSTLSSNRFIINGLYIFVGLNLIFVFQTALRNLIYIDQYGLTEKRIGVFFYLLMCSISAILAIIGMMNRFNAKFLYRQMGLATLLVLVGASLINWSTTITKYNLAHVPEYHGFIDYSYLLTLNESNLPLLITHQTKMPPDEAQWLQNKVSSHQSNSSNTNRDLRSFVIDDWQLEKKLSNINMEQ